MQLSGLLGFPLGEEQAPGEQVELREEKGSRIRAALPQGSLEKRPLQPKGCQRDPLPHQYSTETKKYVSGTG